MDTIFDEKYTESYISAFRLFVYCIGLIYIGILVNFYPETDLWDFPSPKNEWKTDATIQLQDMAIFQKFGLGYLNVIIAIVIGSGFLSLILALLYKLHELRSENLNNTQNNN